MRDNSSRRGAADLGTPLMIVSFIVIGGFLFWLYRQSEAEEQLQIQEAQEAAAEQARQERRAELLVAPTELEMDASPLAGDSVLVEGQSVASRLGSQGFWLEMPNGNPFLVSFSEAVKAEGLEIATGQTTNVLGVVTAMNDSILTAWTESGSINEGDRLAAEFATHFIEAAEVEITEGPPEEGADSAQAGDGSGGAAEDGEAGGDGG